MRQLYVHDLLHFYPVCADACHTQSSDLSANDILYGNEGGSGNGAALSSTQDGHEGSDSTVSFIGCLFWAPR